MKRFYLFLTVLLLNLSAIGQFLTEGFETSVPPTGWTLYQVTGTNGWVQTTAQVNSGTYSAYVDDVNGAADSWLITSVIDLSSSTNPKFYYYEYVAYSSWAEEHNVLVSTDYTGSGDPTLATWTTLNSTIGADYTWVEIGPIDLSSYKSSTVYIAWQYVGDYDSEWYIDDVLVEEPAACPAPAADSTRNITQTTADVYWTENGTATEWQVEYGLDGYTAGEGTKLKVTSSTDTTLDGLNANTSYDWYVRSVCGVGDTSSWSNGLSFTTSCSGNTTFPYSESFDGTTFPPDCWGNEQTSGPGSGLWDRQTSGSFPTCSPHSGAGMTRFNCFNYSGGTAGILISPPMNFPDDKYRVRFWMYRDNGYSSNTDLVNVYYNSQPDLNGATLLGTINRYVSFAPVEASVGWYEYSYDMPTGSGGTERFVIFEGVSDYGNNIFLDDVYLEEQPACPAPTADSTNNITQTTADVYWTENVTATEWQVEYGPKGYTAGTGTKVTPTVVDGDDTTISGLSHSTDYDWYVRSICGPGDTSLWSNGLSFTTDCGAISTFPYTQDFDAWTSSSPITGCTPDGTVALESCWVNASGDDIDWDILSGSTGSSSTGPSSDHTTGTGKYIYTESSSCWDNTGYVLTPEFDFTGVFPTLTFWYHMYGVTMGTLSLQASTDGGSSWSSDLWSLSGDQGDSWYKAEVNIGSYYDESSVIFRFTGLTGSSDWYSDMAIDDFSITALTDPTISVTPDSVNYGECPLNNLSSEYYTREIVVQNIGPGTLTINSVSVTGTNSSDFSKTDNNSYPVGLSGTDSLVFEVKFDPQSTGDKVANLSITTASRADYEYPLVGEAYVAPAQNLTGETTASYINELDWDPPLPEGELRYDNGIITTWIWINDGGFPEQTVSQGFFSTRLTAPVNGDLEYISLFCRNAGPGNDWDEILVCPDDGNGEPDLSSPYEVFNDVVVSSTTGEWIILQLSSPESLTQGTDFFIVSHYPDGNEGGPDLAANENLNYGRCAYSVDSAANWVFYDAAWIMRGYMTTAKDGGGLMLTSGEPSLALEGLDAISLPRTEFELQTRRYREVTLPGIYETNGSRGFVDYSVHRGTTTQTYTTSFTGISNTEYTDTDAALVPGTQYFYAVTANYSGGMVSDTSNEISLTLLDLPTAPSNPDPADAATDVQRDSDLGWQNNGNVQNVDLYLSKTQDSVLNKLAGSAKKLDNVSDTNAFDPGILDESTWYWRVVARDGVSTEVDGPVWSFDVEDTLGPVITYTPLDNTISTVARTIVDTIRDISGVPTSGGGLPVLAWKINAAGTWNTVTATSLGNDQYSFTFGSGASNGDTIYYYTLAQDNASNKNVAAAPAAGAGGFSSDPPGATTPPTNPEFYRILDVFTGSKSVGSGGDFTTLTGDGGLFESLNNGAMTGNMLVTITGDIVEPGTHNLDEIRMEGGDWTLTIQPALPTRATVTVSGNVSGALISLNGADNVTIDGMNDMAFINEATTSASVFSLTNGASNNTIQGCEISTGSKTSGSSFCIYSSGSDNDTNTFKNNILTKAYYGIYLNGSSSNFNSGNIIKNNIIGADTNTSGGMDTLLARYGIYCNYQTNLTIMDNTVKNLIYSSAPYGIYANFCSNVVIGDNIVHDIAYTGTTGYGGTGILYGAPLDEPVPGALIVNNIIRAIAGDGDVPNSGNADGWNPTGIRLKGTTTGGINIYHNSIYMQPDTNYGLAPSDNPNWCGGVIIDAGVTGINFVNNIVFNEMGEKAGETLDTYGAAIWCKATTSPFDTVDNNLYYTQEFDNNVTGITGTTSPPTTYNLDSWKAFTGQESLSEYDDPLFTNTGLELTDPGSPAIGEGGKLPAVSDDIDGNSRHEYFPTIGAREYAATFVGIWTGAVDDDWTDPDNWDFSTSIIPGATHNVAIPTSPSGGNFPNIANGVNGVCKKLHVDPSATVNVENGGTLTVQD